MLTGRLLEIRVFSEAVLVVSNAGAVMDESTIDKLVEPFNRGSRTPQSAIRRSSRNRLGLSIVQSVAAQHHRSLDVAVRARGGLVAHLRLAPLSGATSGHTDASRTDVTVTEKVRLLDTRTRSATSLTPRFARSLLSLLPDFATPRTLTSAVPSKNWRRGA